MEKIAFWPNEGPVPLSWVLEQQQKHEEFLKVEGNKLVIIQSQREHREKVDAGRPGV